MLLRSPRAFAGLLVALGAGLTAYFGEQRWRMPEWTAAEVEQSVELNLAIDLERRGPHLQPSGARLEQLRDGLRREVEAEIRRERAEPERWIGFGLLLMVAGFGQWLGSAWLARRGPR